MIQKLKSVIMYLAIIGLGLGAGYVVPRIPHWLKAPYTEGNFAAYYPDAKIQVAVYGTETCPFCAKTREFLTAQNIPFADFNIDKSPKAKQEFSTLKGEGVPVVLIGNRRIDGFNKEAIEKALAQAQIKGS